MTGAALILAVGSCRPAEEPGDPVELGFADYVGPQQHQISTDLILPDREKYGHRLGFGWAVKHPGGLDEAVIEMRRETARARFFSAAADADSLEIEAYWSGDSAKEAPPIGLLLNGQYLAHLEAGDRWQSYRVDIPAWRVRQGVNLLELHREDTGASQKRRKRYPRYLRLRHLRIHTPKNRSPWPERPVEITLLDESPGTSGKPVIQMPTESYLDLVTELPGRARLVGHYTVEFPLERAREAVTLAVELLDEKGRTRKLMTKKVRRPTEKPQRLSVDLGRWSGELVRLRLRIAGPGEALIQWHDPKVLGRGGSGNATLQGNEAAFTPPHSGRLGRPNVVFIMLDAARADAFSCFGGPYPTPTLDRLAEEGTRFSRALAPSSWTGQSVPAIFTGLFPDTLDMDHWGSRLPPSVPTFAALLQEAGYDTLLYSQHPFYRWHDDLQSGFEKVRLAGSRVVHASELTQWLEESPGPSFAFVHLMPPHTPYEPPDPYRGLYSSWYQGEVPVTAEFLNRFPHRLTKKDLDAEDLRYIKDRYLEHAVFADSQVAAVLSVLEELDQYDDALIVVLADHGEAFLEHSFFLHGQRLYDEFVHVPLLIKWPRSVDGFSSSIDQPVSLVDLVPTLVDGLDLPSDRGFQGISLLPVAFGEKPLQRPLYSTTRGAGPRSQPPTTSSMLLMDGWKIIHNRISFEDELYYLTDDPGEKRNLAAEMPVKALLLHQEIQRRMWLNKGFLESGGGEIDLETLDPKDIENLKALGYLN
jgi:arylsulfatase